MRHLEELFRTIHDCVWAPDPSKPLTGYQGMTKLLQTGIREVKGEVTCPNCGTELTVYFYGKDDV